MAISIFSFILITTNYFFFDFKSKNEIIFSFKKFMLLNNLFNAIQKILLESKVDVSSDRISIDFFEYKNGCGVKKSCFKKRSFEVIFKDGFLFVNSKKLIKLDSFEVRKGNGFIEIKACIKRCIKKVLFL